MDNPPDLIVAPQHEKKKVFLTEELIQPAEDRLAKLQLDNYALECEIQQLRSQLAQRNSTEFHEQSRLLQQRFYDELQSIMSDHLLFIEQTSAQLSAHLTDVLRKSIESIESLRLLHQKELSSQSTELTECLQQQSTEMNELCLHLLEPQGTSSARTLVQPLIEHCRTSLNDLRIGFNTKVNYLTDIHSSTVETLSSKHQREVGELHCELELFSNKAR